MGFGPAIKQAGGRAGEFESAASGFLIESTLRKGRLCCVVAWLHRVVQPWHRITTSEHHSSPIPSSSPFPPRRSQHPFRHGQGIRASGSSRQTHPRAPGMTPCSRRWKVASGRRSRPGRLARAIGSAGTCRCRSAPVRARMRASSRGSGNERWCLRDWSVYLVQSSLGYQANDTSYRAPTRINRHPRLTHPFGYGNVHPRRSSRLVKQLDTSRGRLTSSGER